MSVRTDMLLQMTKRAAVHDNAHARAGARRMHKHTRTHATGPHARTAGLGGVPLASSCAFSEQALQVTPLSCRSFFRSLIFIFSSGVSSLSRASCRSFSTSSSLRRPGFASSAAAWQHLAAHRHTGALVAAFPLRTRTREAGAARRTAATAQTRGARGSLTAETPRPRAATAASASSVLTSSSNLPAQTAACVASVRLPAPL